MKKQRYKLTMLLLLGVVLASCQKQDETIPGFEEESCRITKKYIYYEDLVFHHNYEYDVTGKLVRIINYLEGDSQDTFIAYHQYNEEGLLLNLYYDYLGENDYSQKHTYEYDVNGEIVKEFIEYTNYDGNIVYYKYDYNSNGTTTKTLYAIHDYDEEGNPVYIPSRYNKLIYDDQGNVIEEQIYSFFEINLLEQITYEYEYDERGNIKRDYYKKYVNGQLKYAHEVEYEYNCN